MSRLAAVAVLLLGLAACALADGYYGESGGGGGGSSPPQVAAPTPLPTPTSSPSSAGRGTSPPPSPGKGRTITIDPWTLPGGDVPLFEEQFAKVGDTIVFMSQGTHGLFSIPSFTCPQEFVDSPPLKQIAAPTENGRFTVVLDKPGTRFYACPVPGHCPAGMLVQVTVSA